MNTSRRKSPLALVTGSLKLAGALSRIALITAWERLIGGILGLETLRTKKR